MKKWVNPVAAGVTAAMAAGAAAYLLTGKKNRSMKKIKKSAGKMMRVVEDIAGNVIAMTK